MTKEERLDLIEQQVLPVLDNLWEEHQNEKKCILPEWVANLLELPVGKHVGNQQYDMLRNELFAARPASEVFNTASAANLEISHKKFAHDPPMTSISKASHQDRSVQEQQLFDWLDKCTSSAPESARKGLQITEDALFNDKPLSYPEDYYYQAFKLDGVALALYYNDKGELIKAGLRPRDGREGEDVTENVKYISGIPLKLNRPIACSPRGEIICKLSDFEEVQKQLAAEGEDLRANPRNHASGGVRQFKNPSKTKKMRLTFIAYSIEGVDNPPWKTEVQRAKYCNQILGIPFVQVQPFRFSDLDRMEEIAKTKLNYQTDGVVIGVNDLSLQEELGRHGDQRTGNPKGKIAWKFEEEQASPVIKDIELQTGRGGSITPVAIFDPVELGGTKVGRATLHNFGFMIRNQIGIGTKILVIKAGNIIPKVIGVVSGNFGWWAGSSIRMGRQEPGHIEVCRDGIAFNPKSTSPLVISMQRCPSCEHPTRIIHSQGKNGSPDMYELFCDNKHGCPAQNIGGLLHYLKIFGVLGLGESKVTQLMQAGLVKYPAHFYKLSEGDCIAAGMSERQALLALASVHMVADPEKVQENAKLRLIVRKAASSKKTIPVWKLFASFGIDTAGKSCGKALSDQFGGDFQAIREADVAILASVKDVGEKTAEIVYSYLRSHSQEIDDLLQYVQIDAPVTGPLSGRTYVLTGGFPDGKRHWETEIEKRGGKTSGSVSKSSTNFVVVGTDAGEKEEKAKKYNIPTITLEQLQKDHLK